MQQTLVKTDDNASLENDEICSEPDRPSIFDGILGHDDHVVSDVRRPPRRDPDRHTEHLDKEDLP